MVFFATIMNNNVEKTTNKHYASKTDAFKSKKVNPPPIRPGVRYINAEDEDQMVRIRRNKNEN